MILIWYNLQDDMMKVADILDYYDLDIQYFIKNQPMIVHQNCSSNPHYENSYRQVKIMKEFVWITKQE
jgi:hypothetical protein